KTIGARAIAPLVESTNRNLMSTRNSGSPAIDIANAYIIDLTTGAEPKTAATTLRRLPSVLYAEPDFYVSGMSTDPYPLPSSLVKQAQGQGGLSSPSQMQLNATAMSAKLPTNFGTVSSLQSYLNANGVNYYGAYAEIAHKFGQLPGQGEIVTNVSVGDLTDQSMADHGDQYVQANGPTSVVIGNQRYLDLPSLPLIPT